MTIKVMSDGRLYRAYVPGTPGYQWGSGVSAAAAIGELFLMYPTSMGIVLDLSEAIMSLSTPSPDADADLVAAIREWQVP